MFSSLIPALALSTLSISTIYLWWKSKAETRLGNAAYWALLPVGPGIAINLSRYSKLGYPEGMYAAMAGLIPVAILFALIGSLIKPKAHNKIKDWVFTHPTTEIQINHTNSQQPKNRGFLVYILVNYR